MKNHKPAHIVRVSFLLSIFLIPTVTSKPQEPASDPASGDPGYILTENPVRHPTRECIDEHFLHHFQLIEEWYHSAEFTPIWTSRSARDFMAILKNCAVEGLNPDNYHYPKLLALQSQKTRTPEENIDLENLLTDAFLLYAMDLMYGNIDPASIYFHYTPEARSVEPCLLLQDLARAPSITELISQLRPGLPSYEGLLAKIAEYRKIAEEGGWNLPEYHSSFEMGDSHEHIGQIKAYLQLTGDLQMDTANHDMFDEALRLAIIQFQQRHGLEADGKIGKSTLLAMNVPVEERILEMQIALEQMRWLPNDPGGYYVLVNIPAYHMVVVKEDSIELAMDVAVGKVYRKTPVFNSVIDHLVINPFWRVPPTILKNDLLPAQVKNNDYLRTKNIEVVDYKTGQVLDLADIEWDSISTQNFPYLLRQNPGKDNALGTVKFSFPNPYNIYMHDTNNHTIFNKTRRAVSSGCIRLSRPEEFAMYLLHCQEEWDEVRLQGVMRSKQDYAILLKDKPNVYIHYQTAFVDESGRLNFRPDIYGVNELIRDELQKGNALAL